jgi:hypothetical protein
MCRMSRSRFHAWPACVPAPQDVPCSVDVGVVAVSSTTSKEGRASSHDRAGARDSR